MKYFLPLFLFIFISINVVAQQDNRIAPLTIDLEKIDLLEMAAVDNKALIKEEMKQQKKGRPSQFAYTFDIYQSTQQIGTWTTLSDGSIIWRLRIHSNKAKSLNLGFSKYRMPVGGTMIIYTPDYKNILGPFTPSDNEAHEQLWTPVIDGDELIVEVWLKENNRQKFELELRSINHDFVGINSSSSFLSGACNLDAICGQADGWAMVDEYRQSIQSVALAQRNGNTICTGFLVNNTTQDCTPLFMTANHCEFTVDNTPSLVAYWNYENNVCRQPNSPQSGMDGNGLLNNFNTGAIMRASWEGSDFTIVELDDPVNLSANAYRAGWDATTSPVTNAVCVHHPRTEEKRISFDFDPIVIDGNFSTVSDWDIGTTEVGSSGAPLFDQNKRIIGQLFGGTAACGNDEFDSFGSFSASWEGGGTSTNRLRDWIDPINSGIMTVDGKSCEFSVLPDNPLVEICAPSTAVYQLTVSTTFTNNVNLTVNNLPAGFTTNLSNNTPSPGEIITLTIGNTTGQPFGNYPFTVNGSDGIESSVTNLFLELFDDIPAISNLTAPADMSIDLTIVPTLEWTATSASSYEIEIATDANFANIVISNPMLTTTSFVVNTPLNPLTTYFWRIRGNNLCGTGNWSNANSFTTANIVCGTSLSVDGTLPISAGAPPNTTVSTLEVLNGGLIADINVVNLQGTHTWLSDLTFTLESPSGTSVVLLSGECQDTDNFDINFDDQSSGILPCPYNDGGTYAPSGSLAFFNDENPQGTWTLTVEDDSNFDGGNLNSWGLEFCIMPDNSRDIIPANINFTNCENTSTNFQIYIGGGFEAPIQVAQVGGGNGVDLTFPSNPTPGSSVTATLTTAASVAEGNYPIEFAVTDATGSTMSTINVAVINAPSIPTPMLPLDQSVEVLTNPNFSWNNSGNFDSQVLMVALDPNFANDIIINETLPATNTAFSFAGTLVAETTYYWTISGVNECGTTTSPTFSFTTNTVLSIDKLGNQYFELLPNPTHGNLTINLAYPLGDVIQGEIYHINGQLLDQFNIPFGQQSYDLDLSNFPNGIYVVKLRHDRFIATNKVVLN